MASSPSATASTPPSAVLRTVPTTPRPCATWIGEVAEADPLHPPRNARLHALGHAYSLAMGQVTLVILSPCLSFLADVQPLDDLPKTA